MQVHHVIKHIPDPGYVPLARIIPRASQEDQIVWLLEALRYATNRIRLLEEAAREGRPIVPARS